MGRMSKGSFASLVCGCLMLAACGNAQSDEEVVLTHGSSIVPDQTIEDLVTYGDVAVVFEVVSESELSPSKEERARGEGTITREVVAQQVGEPVWVRPTRSKSAPRPEKRWEISDGGWLFHGKKRTRMLAEGQDTLVVGSRYLAVRTYSSISGLPPEWFSLTYIPLEDGQVRFSKRALSGSTPDLKRLQGVADDKVADLLDSTKPDPAAVPYMKLDAYERYGKVDG